jgi:hypothetical protein
MLLAGKSHVFACGSNLPVGWLLQAPQALSAN